MPHLVDPTLRPFYVDIYAAIREAWLDYGIGPSRYELAVACLCSSTTVMQGIRELRQRGYIEAPKFGVRALRPTDPERTISREPPDPWAALQPQKFFKGTKENKRRNKPG